MVKLIIQDLIPYDQWLQLFLRCGNRLLCDPGVRYIYADKRL